MDRNEIIFFIIILIAYIICSQALKIPDYINYIIIGLIIITLTIAVVMNYTSKQSYEKKYRIMKILSVISFIMLLVEGFFELYLHKTLIPSLILIFILLDLIIATYYVKNRIVDL